MKHSITKIEGSSKKYLLEFSHYSRIAFSFELNEDEIKTLGFDLIAALPQSIMDEEAKRFNAVRALTAIQANDKEGV